jgi:hypothetical protein
VEKEKKADHGIGKNIQTTEYRESGKTSSKVLKIKHPESKERKRKQVLILADLSTLCKYILDSTLLSLLLLFITQCQKF